VISSLINSVEDAFNAERKCKTLHERAQAQERTNELLRTTWPLLHHYWQQSRGKSPRRNGSH